MNTTDQVSIIGLFTKEANDQADKHIKSISNLVRTDGSHVRNISNEAGLSLYMMSK